MIELEVKFLLKDIQQLVHRLKLLGAALVSPEVHELNLRFDLADGSLTAAHRVLRLRRDAATRLTYKGPGNREGDLFAREEIEFEVPDFDAARAFLEALGYRVSMVYEKYRTTYHLGEVEIVLDRTPIGDFLELEGPEPGAIRDAAASLGLDWSAAFQGSYAELFERAKASLGLDFRDLTFDNFQGLEVRAEDLGLPLADSLIR